MLPTNPNLPPPPRGIALIMVLASIAVIAMLVLAFLSNARTEHHSASISTNITEARTLADLPINLAIGQIRRATEQNGLEKTWASQPGLIRVFGTEPDPQNDPDATRAKTIALYKLYSDDTMVVTPINASATNNGMQLPTVKTALDNDTNDLATWNLTPGLYTDINEPSPVIDASTNKVQTIFPISDPRATFSRNNGKPVDGFNINTNAIPGTSAPASTNDVSARLPMPVKWLYLLADGQLLSPVAHPNGTSIHFPTSSPPTTNNPIVGRIAFWTDDDTAKININTATEGTHWDTPRAYNATTVKFARRQPAQNEFSRYPGHPAQTSLSPVFQAFGNPFIVEPNLSETTLATVLERYHSISPRIAWGGSKGGTLAPTTSVLSNKTDRLYTTLDELIFTRERLPQTPTLTQQDIATARFFLTTHSRAPELNLFNQPRLMLWPISAELTQRNAKDKLLAHVGSGGGQAYYFTREKNFKDYTDFGSAQRIREDLDLSTANGSATQKRNRELYTNFLVPLTGANGANGHNIPGFSSNFAAKYTAIRRDQILTEMIDFLRWSVNSYSTSAGLSPSYTYTPHRIQDRRGESSAVPLIPGNNTKGFGRFPTITEATIVFMATNKDNSGATTRMQAFIILEPFNPTVGPPSMAANVRYRIKGLDQFKVVTNTERPLAFLSESTIRCNTAAGYLDSGGNTAFTGIAQQFKKANLTSGEADKFVESSRLIQRGNEDTTYPFYSAFIPTAGLQNFQFKGGTITIEILTGFPTPGNEELVQTLHLHFPDATLKTPRLTDDNYNTLLKRIEVNPTNYVHTLIRDGDITRSVEINTHGPTHGDLRILSATSTVPQTWFTTHPSYTDTNIERLHFLRLGNEMVYGQYGPADSTNGPLGMSRPHSNTTRASTLNTAGTLVQGLHYSRDSIPAVARGQNGALNLDNRPGDFDNGIGRIEDGPYINKTDESNIASNNTIPDSDLGYFKRHNFALETGVSFSPNRQITSAISFGSLPSGIYGSTPTNTHPNRPWQTLLFNPIPPSRSTAANKEPTAIDHEGFKGPRDHLWLDLFWMPIVEPYAISESFSTAGKINMNYQLIPFHHIERSTGIHALLKPTRLSAISPSSVGGITPAGYDNVGGENYKEGTLHKHELYYQINRSETLKGFTRRFNTGDIFRSASEICEIFLVPQRLPGATYNSDAKPPPTNYDDMVTWWNGNLNQVDAFEPTGDNSREAPYNTLYPRLTTKSNTYTIHYRVQTLQKARSSTPDQWIENQDTILSEHRGSATLERYLDPNDPQLTNLATNPPNHQQSWDRFYRFRILNRKTFSP